MMTVYRTDNEAEARLVLGALHPRLSRDHALALTAIAQYDDAVGLTKLAACSNDMIDEIVPNGRGSRKMRQAE